MANRLSTRIILRNDSTSGWATIQNDDNYILFKGEIGLEFVTVAKTVGDELIESFTGKVKMKIGNGTDTWADLPYFGGDECHVTEVTVAKGENHKNAISNAIADNIINKGDIAIVKEAIIALEEGQSIDLNGNIVSSDSTIICAQKYQYTAYVYGEIADGSSDWKAMDGNYSANNVYFNNDFVFTTNVGTVTGVTSSRTVAAKGKSVKQFFDGLFAREIAGGKKVDPYVNVTLKNGNSTISSNTSYEVGTSVSPSYVATFEDGTYTYGPEPTGVTVVSWNVTSTGGNSWSTSSGDGDTFTVGDSTNYSITATAAHTAGKYALSNIGNTGTYQFAAGSKSKTSTVISGYRAQFYGSNTSVKELNSNNIRALEGKCKPGNTFTGKYARGNGFNLEVKEGSQQIIIALYGKELKNVYDTGAFGTDIRSSFTEVSATTNIAVTGANGYVGVNYRVYTYTPAAALGKNTYEVVIG